jgi:hypothetical protein
MKGRRTAVATLAAAALATAGLAVASPARAELTCPTPTYVQPFLPWLDPANYVLMPNGSLESTAGWTLSGGAGLVSGNEPFLVSSKTDSHSLSLPAGATARTPSMCFTLASPTLRFFVVNTSKGGTLKVQATSAALGLLPLTLTIAQLPALPVWTPSLPLPFLLNLASPLTGPITFTFTAVGGSFRIDDVYVDPMKHR